MEYISRLKSETDGIKSEYARHFETKVEDEVELKVLFREIRRHSDNINTLKKQIDNAKKDYKSEEKYYYIQCASP